MGRPATRRDTSRALERRLSAWTSTQGSKLASAARNGSGSQAAAPRPDSDSRKQRRELTLGSLAGLLQAGGGDRAGRVRGVAADDVVAADLDGPARVLQAQHVPAD